MPWLNGIIDGINASNLIRASTIEHKNRFAFILLDSTLEIAFKNFLTNVKKIPKLDDSIWKSRDAIIKIVKKNSSLDKEVWEDIEYFYKIRTGLYHEDSEKTVTDGTVNDFQELVQFCIEELFTIRCSDLIPMVQTLLPIGSTEITKIPINRIPEKINVVVVAVAESESKNPQDILEVLKKKGFRGQINSSTITIYLNHTFSYLFHNEEGIWKLSEEGKGRYEEMKNTYLAKNKEGESNGK